MWYKEIITEDSYDSFIRGIRRCEVNKLAYTTKAGISYPDKCLVMYVYYCSLNAAKAMDDQIRYLLDIQKELTNSCLNNSESGIKQAFYNIRRSYKIGQSIFAGSVGTNEWIDIDVDLENKNDSIKMQVYNIIIGILIEEIGGKANYAIIETANGFHCLIKKAALHKDPNSIIVKMKYTLTNFSIKEIVKNVNYQLPLPGTLAYGSHVIKVLNKTDFN